MSITPAPRGEPGPVPDGCCDGASVGVLITNEHDELLLIRRANPPIAWAPPAG